MIVALYHDTRHQLINNKYPVKIRVTFSRAKRLYLKTGVALSIDEFENLSKKSLKNEREALIKLQNKAIEIGKDYPNLSPKLFKAIFTGRYSYTANVNKLFEEKCTTLQQSGHISTYRSYKNTAANLHRYSHALNLNVIDKDWLKDYEHHRLSAGVSRSTVGIDTRNLRTIFNMAIQRKIISADLYPFGRGGYSPPSSTKFKKRVPEADKIKFLHYTPTNKLQKIGYFFWTFSYYCYGMNLKDIVLLEPKDIQNNFIICYRQKTKQTEARQTPIIIPIRPEVHALLNEFKARKKKARYIFGFVKDNLTPLQLYHRITTLCKIANRGIKQICEALHITVFKFKIARHTMSSTLLENGANVVDIKDALGHASLSTTEHYLASLEGNQSKNKKLVGLL